MLDYLVLQLLDDLIAHVAGYSLVEHRASEGTIIPIIRKTAPKEPMV